MPSLETLEPAGAPALAAPGRRLATACALLCLLGLAVSAELTRIHVLVHTDPSYHSVCAVSEGVDCETVAASSYSVFAGLPVSLWGVAGYLLMGALWLWARGRRRPHSSWPLGLLLALTAGAAAASAALAFISATRIDSLCLFCLGSYAINAALLGLVLVAWRRSRAPAKQLLERDVRTLWARPAPSAGLAVVGVMALVGLRVGLPSYWRAPGWSDLPVLASGVDDGGHHWTGAAEPRLTVVEFSDYECPHCRAAHKAMRALAARYPERVRLVHRHLPLDRACHPELTRPFHERACLFAEAAECAGLQGRFWEMNDALFSVQETLRSADVDPVALAVRLGLDRSDFKRCLEDHAAGPRVAADLREAMSRRLEGTPSFLVGERLFLGRIPEAELEGLLAGRPQGSGPRGDETAGRPADTRAND